MSETPDRPVARPVARYVILHDGSSWQINIAGKNYGPYATQAVAIADAIETAQKAQRSGYRAMVLSQGGDGLFKTEWEGGET